MAARSGPDRRLGASFFCSRDFEDRSNLAFIFPTLAVQLARKYPKFRSLFIPLVESDPEISYDSLCNQMDKLIVQPLAESAISTVIVIDALDECKDEEPASAILSVIGRFASKLPTVKFFLTGRPEPRIREGFRLPLLAKATDIFILHDVEPSLVNTDIRLFFKHSFLEVTRRRSGLDGWPTDEQLDLLCKRAAGLFVYAVATVKFIDHKNNDPRGQLDALLQSPQITSHEGKTKLKANTTLDLLYMTIIQEAFGEDNPESNDPKVHSILGAIVLAANPLSPSAIAMLFNFNVVDVSLRLSSVQSLLLLQDDINYPVKPYHKSFPDFITDPSRCTDPRFYISPPDQNSKILLSCLKLMGGILERNMCKLPEAVINSEVDDIKERKEKYLNHALQYACKSWHKHLDNRDPAHMSKITSVLHAFLEEKFLQWLEVLSVLGAVRNAIEALDAAARWLKVGWAFILVLLSTFTNSDSGTIYSGPYQ